jgi:CheY-like chemotaxis protein
MSVSHDSVTSSDRRKIPHAMVVHGDATTRRICRRVLEESGFMVNETDSGVGAVASIRQATPDVIVIDDQLRDVPGWQAAVWLHSVPALRSIPIVILGVEPVLAAESLAVRSTTWLPKPFSARALRRAIETAVAGSLFPQPRIEAPSAKSAPAA